ncbi:MAG: metallophosphoesterase [Candidatus Heimdallarchaeaceae archaeon]
MKIMLLGDLHITTNQPKKRIDNYFKAIKKKLFYILILAEQEGCSLILQPGDFFDSHKANDFLKREMIKILLEDKVNLKTVFGQHDLRYHSSDTNNTPLRVLEAAGALNILGYEQIMTTHLYGASWFEDIPEVTTKGINILVIHKMIIKDKLLWEGQEDATKGNILLRTHNFDLIVAGDNHASFVCSSKSKHLVNCGSLMRMTTAQLDHKPVVYIYDTKDKSIEEHFIPIEPVEKVFDLSTIEKEKKENKELEAFISHLKSDTKIEGLNYAKNLKGYLKENVIEQGTLDIIKEVIE